MWNIFNIPHEIEEAETSLIEFYEFEDKNTISTTKNILIEIQEEEEKKQREEENNFSQIIKDINEFSSIKGISENLNEEKFDNFLKDLIEQVDNLKLESRLKDAEKSLSKNMNEAQYNELLSLKDQIVASKKV